jgi:Ni,Fe-hydrogenase I cytochrome b subunit
MSQRLKLFGNSTQKLVNFNIFGVPQRLYNCVKSVPIFILIATSYFLSNGKEINSFGYKNDFLRIPLKKSRWIYL